MGAAPISCLGASGWQGSEGWYEMGLTRPAGSALICTMRAGRSGIARTPSESMLAHRSVASPCSGRSQALSPTQHESMALSCVPDEMSDEEEPERDQLGDRRVEAECLQAELIATSGWSGLASG